MTFAACEKSTACSAAMNMPFNRTRRAGGASGEHWRTFAWRKRHEAEIPASTVSRKLEGGIDELSAKGRAMVRATLYTVNGPRGCYFAVRNHHTGLVWTERTELAARSQAAEQGLDIVEEQEVPHERMLQLMGAGLSVNQSNSRSATVNHGRVSGFFRRWLRRGDRVTGRR